MAMNVLSIDNTRGLCWVQLRDPGVRRFELCAGESRFARLRFAVPNSTSQARAELATEAWVFQWEGLLKRHVTVCRLGGEQTRAIYTRDWTGSRGILELSGGRTFCWKEACSRGDRYRFEDADGVSVVFIKPEFYRFDQSCLFGMQADVEICPPGFTLPDLPLLVSLGWYLVVSCKEEVALVPSLF